MHDRPAQAVSRSALARLFIGSTAERVLDKLGCDVLIVKPRGFAAKVARAPSVRKSVRSKRAAAPVWPARRERDSMLPPLL
jgi:universal stress protein family protein